MQLKITTDYAVKIVLYLAIERRIITSHELSNALCIPQSMVLKIGRRLSDAEILDISTGVQGGFSLKKNYRCLEEDEFCSREAVPYCTVRQTYRMIQDDLEKRLSKITIHDLIK